MPLKWDLQNENFSYYFLEQSMQMSERQRSLLPPQLLFKIFTKGNRVNSKSTSKLSFIEKIFVLVRALNKRWILLVEDDEKGMNVEDFFKYKEQTKKRNYTMDSAEDFSSEGEFVLGDSELFDTFYKLNCLSISPAYNYLMKVKTKDYFKPDEYKKAMKFLVNWINNYESKRKKIVTEGGITMAEWITLTYLYDGEEKQGSILYTEKFLYSYNTSRTKIKLSFGSLQDKGYIIKYGSGRGAKLQITSLGKDKLTSILVKNVVNC